MMPNAEGLFATDEPYQLFTDYKFKIVCGCGLYDADDLDDYDSHLGEVVAEDDGNIMLHIKRTSVVMVQVNTEEEKQAISVDEPIPYDPTINAWFGSSEYNTGVNHE